MSADQDNRPVVDTEDLEQEAVVETPRRKRFEFNPTIRWLLIFGGLVLVVVGVAAYTTSRSIPASRMSNAPALDNTPGGSAQAQSPAYQQALEQSNDTNAAQALQTNSTFVATPEGLLAPVEPVATDDPEPFTVQPVVRERPTVAALPAPVIPRAPQPVVVAPPPPAADPEPVAAKPQQPVENPYTRRILQQMTQVANAWKAPSSNTVKFDMPSEQTAPVAAEGGSETGAGAAAGEIKPTIVVAPGTILYGETLTTTTSDNRAPVVVEITTGELKGARLVGGFEVAQGSERMVISFNSLTLPDGETLQTAAFAVDGRSAEAAVASDVDQRYLQRYGPIFAAAFVGGFGSSQGRSGATVTEDGIAYSAASMQQSAFAGLGAAANAIAGDLASNAPKGPKITLQAGWPVGILFVAPAAR